MKQIKLSLKEFNIGQLRSIFVRTYICCFQFLVLFRIN